MYRDEDRELGFRFYENIMGIRMVLMIIQDFICTFPRRKNMN